MHKKLNKLVAVISLGIIPLTGICVNDILQDPTQPATSSSEATITQLPNGDIEIAAIFAGTYSKSVIIGSHSFTLGEKVSGLTIDAIDKDGIVLKKEDGSKFRVDKSYHNIKSPIVNKRDSAITTKDGAVLTKEDSNLKDRQPNSFVKLSTK